MFDTHVTIVGNVLTAPEWRRTSNTNSLVANFKVASTARRLNRENGQWVDGNSLRVRVNCWRRLAEGVASSVMVGDPVIVVGRLYTRDWTDAEGNHRTLYELEAVAIGHDLSRGRGKFVRNRPTMTTSEVEDAEAEARVHGEPTEAVSADEVPARPGEYLFDDDDPDFDDIPVAPAPGYDAISVIRGGGFDPGPASGSSYGDPGRGGFGGDGLDTADVVNLSALGLAGEGEVASGGPIGSAREAHGTEAAPVEEGAAGQATAEASGGGGRGRRGRGRSAVPV